MFVKSSISIYGRKFCVYNVHNLIHLPNDCIQHGTLDNFSAFKFENFLHSIKRKLHSSRLPLEQFSNRLVEEHTFQNIFNKNKSESVNVLKTEIYYCNDLPISCKSYKSYYVNNFCFSIYLMCAFYFQIFSVSCYAS